MSDIFSRISSFLSPNTTGEQAARSFLSKDSQFTSVAKPGLNIALNCDLLQQASNGIMLPKTNPCLLINNGSYSHSYPKCYNKYYLPQTFAMPILRNIDQFCLKTITAAQMENKASKKSSSHTNLYSCETTAFNFIPEWKKSGFEPKQIKKPAANNSKSESKPQSIENANIQKPDPQKETIDCFTNRELCAGKQIQMCGNAIINHILGYGEDDDDSEYESDVESIPPTDTECYSTSESEDEDCIWEQITSCRKPWTCDRRFRNKKSLSFTTSSYETESDYSDTDATEKNDRSQSKYDNRTDSDESETEMIPDKSISNRRRDDPITVNRPQCSNDDDISSIVGDDVTSDSEGDSPAKGNSPCRDRSTPPAAGEAREAEHCELWDYFVKLHEPFVERASACLNHEKKDDNCSKAGEGWLPRKPSVVRFDDKIVEHRMITWSFAYKKARKGEWETYARDRERFKARILNVGREINWCLEKQHRDSVFGRM